MSTADQAKVQHRIPGIVPRSLRMRLFGWHPGRARRWRRHPGIQRVGRQSAVLTFDDGPAPDATPSVLSALATSEVKATFFVLGSEVQREQELTRQIIEGGHEIALHGFQHRRQDQLSDEDARADIETGFQIIAEVTGHQPRWYRPPFGRMSEAGMNTCQELGLRVAYWSNWGLDWEDVSHEAIAAQVRSGLSGGSVILLHDTARHGRRESAIPTAQAIESIVNSGRQQGLVWRTLTDADNLQTDADSRPPTPPRDAGVLPRGAPDANAGPETSVG